MSAGVSPSSSDSLLPKVGVQVIEYGISNERISACQALFDHSVRDSIKGIFDQFLISMQSQEENVFKILHGAFLHKKFTILESNLRLLLDKMIPKHLKELLNFFIKEFIEILISESADSKLPQIHREAIKKCLDMVNEDTLSKTIEALLTNVEIEEAIQILGEASKKQSKRNQKELFIKNINKKPYTPGVIETFVTAYSFFSTDQIPNYPWEALQLLQVNVGIIIVPFMVSAAIDDLVHAEPPFTRLNFFYWTVAVIALIFLSMHVYKRFRPIPGEVSPFRTYTSEAQEGRYAPLMGREDVIEQIFTCWASSNDGTRSHPLLVGDAGVGKTAIFTEVARRLVTGEIPEYALNKMKDKKIFGESAAALLPTSSSPIPTNDTMDRALKRFEPHKNDIIVCLDEVHTFWLEKHASTYGELIKRIFDTSVKGFPYLLAATTPADYQKYIAVDPQRSRRFHVIKVDPSNDIQTSLILRDMVQRYYADVNVSDTVISQAFHLTSLHPNLKKYKQPDISKRMLSGAISSVKMKQSVNPFKAFILEKQQERDLLLEKYIAEVDSTKAKKLSKAIEEKKIEIQFLEQQAQSFNIKKGKLEKLQKEFNETQALLLSLAQRIIELRSIKTSSVSPFKKEFIFLKYFKLNALKKDIDDLILELNFTSLENELKLSINNFENQNVNVVSNHASNQSAEGNLKLLQMAQFSYISEVGHIFKTQKDGNFIVCHTRADGACALHAILGEKTGSGIYFLENARLEFVKTLQKNLKEPKVLTRLNQILASYVDECYKTNGRKLADSQLYYLQMLFSILSIELMEVYKTQLHQFEEQEKLLKADERNLIQEMMDEAHAKNHIQALVKIFGCDKAILNKNLQIKPHETFHYSEACFSKFKQANKQDEYLILFKQIGPKFKQNQIDLNSINKQIDDFSLKFVQENQQNFHEAYFRLCRHEGYYLSDLDITLIELLFNKRIEIYAAVNEDQISHNSGEGELVVLYHRGKHYSKCEKIKEPKNPVGKNGDKDEKKGK